MDIKHKFGRRIKEIRAIRGISQEELAFRAGLHRTYVSSLELGNRNVSLLSIEKLAVALECSMEDFFTNKLIRNGRK